MEKNKKRWIGNYLVVVDCLYSTLCDGGVARKDVVVNQTSGCLSRGGFSFVL